MTIKEIEQVTGRGNNGHHNYSQEDLGGAVVDIAYFYEGYSAVQGMMFAREGEKPVCTVNFSVRLIV